MRGINSFKDYRVITFLVAKDKFWNKLIKRQDIYNNKGTRALQKPRTEM